MFPSQDARPFVRYANKFYYVGNSSAPITAFDCRIILVLEGEGRLTVKNEAHALQRFDLVYIPPAVPYLFQSERQMRLTVVNFDFSHAAAAQTNILFPRPSAHFDPTFITALPPAAFAAPLILHRMDGLKGTLDEVVREKRFTDSASAHMCSLLLESCLVRIHRAASAPVSNKEEQLLQSIVSYLDAHATEAQCEASLCATLSYHPYYLNRVFKKCTGQTIHNYVVRTRVRLAADLLLTESSAAEEIASRVGMPNPAHFAKTFRRYMGMTPSAYRKSPPL